MMFFYVQPNNQGIQYCRWDLNYHRWNVSYSIPPCRLPRTFVGQDGSFYFFHPNGSGHYVDQNRSMHPLPAGASWIPTPYHEAEEEEENTSA